MAQLPLVAALADLYASTGARMVRVVDGRRGSEVVAAAGADPGDAGDDPATVARMVGDAVGLGGGGLDDVVVSTGSSVHVLRPTDLPGVFLHLCLPATARAAGIERARNALGAPRLHTCVRAALAPVVELPRPREPVGARASQLPALSALAAARTPAGHGARAVAALAELSRLGSRIPDARLPQRVPSGAPEPGSVLTAMDGGLPERTWACDVPTMRRLLAGLRRLA